MVSSADAEADAQPLDKSSFFVVAKTRKSEVCKTRDRYKAHQRLRRIGTGGKFSSTRHKPLGSIKGKEYFN
jgi:hypothetical protein